MHRFWSSWMRVALSVLVICFIARGPVLWLLGSRLEGTVAIDLSVASVVVGMVVLALVAAIPALIGYAIDRGPTDRWLNFRKQWFWYSFGFAAMSVLIQGLLIAILPRLTAATVVGAIWL